MKALVVYYSRTGHAAQVAEQIAKELGADAERINDKKKRCGIIGWLGAGRDATREIPADIEEPKKDPTAYDLVVVGTPIWAHRMSTPVLAYLKRFSGKLPAVAFFITCGGNYQQTLETMGGLAGKAPMATLVVLDRELKRGEHAVRLLEFVGKLSSPAQ